jgi:hypothetical protein
MEECKTSCRRYTQVPGMCSIQDLPIRIRSGKGSWYVVNPETSCRSKEGGGFPCMWSTQKLPVEVGEGESFPGMWSTLNLTVTKIPVMYSFLGIARPQPQIQHSGVCEQFTVHI